MSKTLTIAWREFAQTVFRPIFLLAIIGLPVIFIGAMALAGYIMATNKEPPLIGAIAVVDETGELTTAAEHEFSTEQMEADRREQIEQVTRDATDPASAGQFDPGRMNTMQSIQRGEVSVTVERANPDDESFDAEAIKQRVREGQLLAAVFVPDNLLQSDVAADGEANNDDQRDLPTRFEMFIAPDVDNDHVDLIERRIGEAIVRVRAQRAGLDPDRTLAMFNAPGSSTVRISQAGEEVSEGEAVRAVKQFIPLGFMILLWLGVFTAGQHLLMSTIEEKSNRVMEVLLSAVSPLQLMTGKILGHGGVGLLITGIYSSVIIAGLIAFAAMKFIEPISLVYLAVFFFMAYFMIASLMAAVGSAVSDVREANTLMTPVMLVVMIPWFLWMPIISAPNGAVAVAFSFIPPMTPFVMILRVCADEPVPVWQIITSIVWGYICVVAMIWMAAKIFRVGVLMYGKPPSPLQLLKWLRYS